MLKLFSKKNKIEKECLIVNSTFISKDISQKILELSEKSIGLISIEIFVNEEKKIRKGTCFLVQIQLPLNEKPIYGFITNNHVLGSDNIEDRKYKIEINNKEVNIKRNERDFKFTCKLIDSTFIQITDDKFIKNENYLFIELCIENTDKLKENPEVFVIQYPGFKNSKKDVFYSSGDIDHLSGFNIYHKASTGKGSSGSPLLNNKMKVIGLHKSASVSEDFNLATNINTIYYAINILYSKKYIYPMEKFIKFPRELSNEENDELKNHGILETSVPYLYKCQYDCDSSSIILFYRTNHAWYCTKVPKNEKFKFKEIEEIELYKWRLFNFYKPIKENLGKMNNYLKHHHKVIFQWLKLSELMYN